MSVYFNKPNTNNVTAVQPVEQAAPVAASTSLANSEFKSPNIAFVVNPPKIQKYSFYNEITPKQDSYIKFLSTTPYVTPELKQSRRKHTIKKIFAVASIGVLSLLILKSAALKNFCVNAYNKVKNLIK